MDIEGQKDGASDEICWQEEGESKMVEKQVMTPSQLARIVVEPANQPSVDSPCEVYVADDEAAMDFSGLRWAPRGLSKEFSVLALRSLDPR